MYMYIRGVRKVSQFNLLPRLQMNNTLFDSPFQHDNTLKDDKRAQSIGKMIDCVHKLICLICITIIIIDIMLFE